MNIQKIEEHVEGILQEIGENLDREGIKFTPKRVARLYKNLFYKYRMKLQVMNEEERNTFVEENTIPITIFKAQSKDLLIRKVNFTSTCEHHFVSITDGQCWVGIIPNKKLLGMNKIDKIVKYFAAGLQIQERLTSEITNWIDENIQPLGVIVVIKANHLCAQLQGDEGIFTTSAVRGVFANEPEARTEFLSLIK